jgi:hypothetical protein
MELNSHQLETIKSLFGHYNWDINIEAENGGNTQDKCTQTESMETETEDENPGFVIEQDQSQNECPYCFCKPCITNEQIQVLERNTTNGLDNVIASGCIKW